MDFCKFLFRKRVFETEQQSETKLNRCLNFWDLMGLGLGSTLGVGIYIIIGHVALETAGPSIVMSFLIAFIASILAGLCYSEFVCRVPKAGSAYIYTYVTVGEFPAFIIGWNTIMESACGAASFAKGLSVYIDLLLHNALSKSLISILPLSVSYLGEYFDAFAFTIVIILGVIMSFGVRNSTMMNTILTAIHLMVLIFIIIAGALKADPNNWSIPATVVPESFGKGGFFPYGFWMTIKSAAICFYAFVGFDCVAYTGEEVAEPTRNIPVAITLVLITTFLVYVGISIVVTMMMPYYLMEEVLTLTSAFSYVGLDWAKWIISVGAIIGIFTSLFSVMFLLPRLLYSMAEDGLLFPCLTKGINKRKAPVLATLISSFIIANMAALIHLEELMIMMCVGTFLSYTFVAASVILLRHQSDCIPETPINYIKQIFGSGAKSPSYVSSRTVTVALVFFVFTCIGMAIVLPTTSIAPYHLVLLATLHILAVLLVIIITVQPKANDELIFKTPLVPLIPCISIYFNINLMILISFDTWIRVLIWIILGIPIYFICTYLYKKGDNSQNKTQICPQTNGKPIVQIIIEPPTPTNTLKSNSDTEREEKIDKRDVDENADIEQINENKENLQDMQYVIVENNEEKEAKIIDLLDQVLQAEEDTYGEIISLKENSELDQSVVSTTPESMAQRKSISEISDAGSDISFGLLSKCDVIAQVHREDLPKVYEEEECNDKDETKYNENTSILKENGNKCDTNSTTDESGYSDTLDKNGSVENVNISESNIPPPPPFPIDENFFSNPNYKKSYTISSRYSKKTVNEQKEHIPRASVQSINSLDDDNMTFGSDKQKKFMSKLNSIFQNTMTLRHKQGKIKRSISTDNFTKNNSYSIPPRRLFLDLKEEISSNKPLQNIKNVSEENRKEELLSKEDFKLKLENLFAIGGTKLLKARVMKSNPPKPEDPIQKDMPGTTSSNPTSSNPIIVTEKNDTLTTQKVKFSEVLNSLKLSMNKDNKI